MPQNVRTWTVILVAAAVTGAPALRTGPAAWAHQGERISKRASSHSKARSRTSARLAPSLVRQERAMIDPPRPTQILRNTWVTSLSTPAQTGPAGYATSCSSFPARHFAVDLASCSSVALLCAADLLLSLACTIV
jgi:hypothetical protein